MLRLILCPEIVLVFFAAVLQCSAQTYDRFASKYDPLGINESPPNTAPLLTIDTEALQTLEASRQRTVIVYTSTTCGPCQTMKAWCGSGDEDVRIEYRDYSEAKIHITGLPAIYSPDSNTLAYGPCSLAELKQRLQRHPPINAPRAVTIGTVKGREAIAKLLDSLQHQNGTATVELGSASVVLPEQLTSTLALSRDAASVSFPAVKPRVKVGTGWLSVAREVAGFKADRSTGLLTISVVSFPDLVFTLE